MWPPASFSARAVTVLLQNAFFVRSQRHNQHCAGAYRVDLLAWHVRETERREARPLNSALWSAVDEHKCIRLIIVLYLYPPGLCSLPTGEGLPTRSVRGLPAGLCRCPWDAPLSAVRGSAEARFFEDVHKTEYRAASSAFYAILHLLVGAVAKAPQAPGMALILVQPRR